MVLPVPLAGTQPVRFAHTGRHRSIEDTSAPSAGSWPNVPDQDDDDDDAGEPYPDANVADWSV